ncbi:hypothetical protein [Allonocardiopsis opalescens]|uniref:LPXTG-motif cell wall-anchored protein n=1 Tax=Allonocardiopsis opalescens TaxID=1144618 RepID=A0A2T0PS88_9ACTN|nr:hypothetical protein [Allonocardiopsis opalescens]PRX91744.1 hypothetical protein CLV72_11426 [Allonocardiopsis opalescens]
MRHLFPRLLAGAAAMAVAGAAAVLAAQPAGADVIGAVEFSDAAGAPVTGGEVTENPFAALATADGGCPDGYGNSYTLQAGPVGGDSFVAMAVAVAAGGYDEAESLPITPRRALTQVTQNPPVAGDYELRIICGSESGEISPDYYATWITVTGTGWALSDEQPDPDPDPSGSPSPSPDPSESPSPDPSETPSPDPSDTPPPADDDLTVTDEEGNELGENPNLLPGQTVNITARGYEPGETVAVTLYGEPVVPPAPSASPSAGPSGSPSPEPSPSDDPGGFPQDVGTQEADDDGVIAFPYTLAESHPDGSFTLAMEGADSAHLVEFGYTVGDGSTPPPTDPGPGGDGDDTPGGDGGGGSLPQTGVAIAGLVLGGLALTGAGYGLMRTGQARKLLSFGRSDDDGPAHA